MNNFNDSSNNINSNHKLINLPHILLNRIINLLDNIDRVCFTLVCKRWFKERDSYLSFDSTYLIKNVDLKYISNFYLQSYKKQIEFSRDIKSDCSLFFSTKEESELLTYDNLFDCNDYIIDLEKIGKEEIEIPKSVENIYFSDSFNSSIEPLTKSLADSNVRYLCFGSNFNQPIKQHTLPSNIKQLNFGMDYNQEFEVGSLPNSLEKLILGRNYNQPLIPNVLPATLKYLSFRLHFDAPIIHGSLPANLEHLEFGRNYCTKFIAEYLPKKLKTINNFSINYLDQLPPSVTTISFARPPTPAPLSEDDIPPTIVNLHFGYYAQPLEENVIPKTLKVLDLGFYYHYPLEKNQLPDTLEELNLGEIYNSPIKPGVLPKSLKKLTLSVNFSHKLEIGSIPYGVESLTFNHMYYHEIQKGIIPDTVTDIIFKSECCTLKHDTLPNSIKSLNIENYELKLPDNAIPPSVETVTISIIFFKDNTMESIPSNVKTIRLYYNYLYYDIKRIGNNNGVDYFLILGDMTTLQGGFVTSNFFNYYLYPNYASAQNYGITINQTSSNYDCLVGSTDCHDILSALNGYAQIKNSSTSLNIYLTEGTYSGVNNTNLIISNSTIIISPVINETGQVTIDLQSNGRFISIGDNQFSYLTLISLTIINGKASQGGVLEVISSAVVFLNNITAYNNNADYGGFLYAAPKVSGRFYIDNNSTMTNNSANVDGSIYYSSSASVLNLYDSTFSENWNSTLIYAVNTAINIANVLIDNNTGSDTLIQITNGNQTIVHFLTMSNNKLSKTTGTSFWRYFYGTGSFYSSNFTNNTGGSVFRYMNSESTTGTLLFYKCSFDSNSGADYGSAIYVDSDSQISLMYITFTSNTANIDAGAVYFDGEANDTSYTQYLSSFSYTTFTNNSATNVNSKANDIYAFATSFNLETVTLYSINTNITANTSAPIYCNSSTVSIGVITTNILDGHIMNCNSGTCTIYGIESQCVSDHSGSSSSEPRYIKPKLSNGQIIGICFGAAGAIAIVVVLFLVYRHQRNKYQSIN